MVPPARFIPVAEETGLIIPPDPTLNGSFGVSVAIAGNLAVIGAPGADDGTGTVTGANIPVSFIVQEVPGVAGTVGEDYNRIEIGGTARLDAKSDHPILNWGHVEVDDGGEDVEDCAAAKGMAVHAPGTVATRICFLDDL